MGFDASSILCKEKLEINDFRAGVNVWGGAFGGAGGQQDTAKQNSLQINRRVLVVPSDKPAQRETEAMATVLKWRGKNACSLAIYRLRA